MYYKLLKTSLNSEICEKLWLDDLIRVSLHHYKVNKTTPSAIKKKVA
jgi:uncharacterized protein YegJ (DUF2314 family)